ncbi:MAG: tRNA-dihydrouridine synthase family protein [Eubacterium sp.]|nr:tRNA-dihydrouridine synthase family protein [Eubacterium sp.]
MKILLAPLEGITTYIYRNALNKYYGGIDRYYTPFLTATHLKGREKRDVLPDNNPGIDLVPQILANEADTFLKITYQLSLLGYREVNLNLGCPSGTVISKNRGAGFLQEPKDLYNFLDDVIDKMEGISLSIKTRIGMEFLSEWEDLMNVYKDFPLSEIIIHPRLRNEFYNGNVHIDQFLRAFDIIPESTNIIYNGDINSISHLIQVLNAIKEVNPDYIERDNFSIMVGRGIIRNPELGSILSKAEIPDLLDPINKEINSSLPKITDKKKFKAFINEITENYQDEMSNEKHVVMKMKELWIYFADGLRLDPKLLKEILKTSRLAEYKSIIQMV